MKLPFTTQEFPEVFEPYNHAIWPLQLLFIIVAFVTIFSVIWKPIISGKIIPVILALLWVWMGGVYHLLFFSIINDAPNIFGVLFILQGILFLKYGLITSQTFKLKKDIYGITASILIMYALVIYPVIGYYAGHAYPYSPAFGLPCPTAIFTFGILVLSKYKLPFYMLIIPLIWAITDCSAAVTSGIYEDTGLIISVLVLSILNLIKPANNQIYRYKSRKIARTINQKMQHA